MSDTVILESKIQEIIAALKPIIGSDETLVVEHVRHLVRTVNQYVRAQRWYHQAIHIHKTVAKRWQVGSPEDIHYIALALGGEVGELQNLIKKDWRGDAGDRSDAIAEELCDIRIYLELLAWCLDVDMDEACNRKIPELFNRWPEALKNAPTHWMEDPLSTLQPRAVRERDALIEALQAEFAPKTVERLLEQAGIAPVAAEAVAR